MSGLTKIQEEILNCMEDEDSQVIYREKLRFMDTGDEEGYTRNVLERTKSTPEWIQNAARKCMDTGKKIVCWGLGHDYRILMDIVEKTGFHADVLCDNNAALWGSRIDGKPVAAPEQWLREKDEYCVFIASTMCAEEIKRELMGKGVRESEIASLADAQYFDVFESVPGEIFVDAGCYNGGTLTGFVNWSKGNYRKIYAFEPNPESLVLCRSTIRDYGMTNVELIEKGTWSKEDRLNFHVDGASSTVFAESGEELVNVTDIDSVLAGGAATYIKMDVEGSEMETLHGAENTILNYKPRLAVCVYHRWDDIVTIPEYLHRLVPEYRFYLRQYNLRMGETVLYAV